MEEVLNRIKSYGALAYTSEQISILEGCDVASLVTEANSPYAIAYAKGRAEADFALDIALYEMALQGDMKAIQEHRASVQRRDNISSRASKKK